MNVCADKLIKKVSFTPTKQGLEQDELTAADLEVAGVGVEGIVVKVHPTRDGYPHPKQYKRYIYCIYIVTRCIEMCDGRTAGPSAE